MSSVKMRDESLCKPTNAAGHSIAKETTFNRITEFDIEHVILIEESDVGIKQ